MIRKFTSIEEVSNLTKDDIFKPQIAIIGIGGAGTNALNNMISMGLSGVKFAVINTDAQSLESSISPYKLQIGPKVTKGLGAGSKPEIGIQAAKESIEEIKHILQDINMLFIACGMGGGTGTGASQVVAQVAKDMGILTIAFVTTPFSFEGNQRYDIAKDGVLELEKYVDSLLIISNENLFKVIDQDTSMVSAFRVMDNVLFSSVKAIVDLITSNGLVNLDFNDIKAILEGSGRTMIGSAEASGEDRAEKVVQNAVVNPLLADVSLNGAKKALINITGGDDMTLYEVNTIINYIKKELSEDAFINFGTVYDTSIGDTIRVSIVATGLNPKVQKQVGDKFFYNANQAKNSQPIKDINLDNVSAVNKLENNLSESKENQIKNLAKIKTTQIKDRVDFVSEKSYFESNIEEIDELEEFDIQENVQQSIEEDTSSLFDFIAKKNKEIKSNVNTEEENKSKKFLKSENIKESSLFELPSFLKKK